jgi:hypothetical protein
MRLYADTMTQSTNATRTNAGLHHNLRKNRHFRARAFFLRKIGRAHFFYESVAGRALFFISGRGLIFWRGLFIYGRGLDS